MATGKGLFGSSLARKYWMALTGLFLITFLIVHLAGNLQLLSEGSEVRDSFNLYSKFMTTFPVIKVVSYLLYASILLHAIDGIALARQNAAARPSKYVKNNAAANSGWASRNMALLGIITLLFIIIHMKSFWYEMHFGDVAKYMIDGDEVKDLYTITVAAFGQWWYTLIYVISMAALGFHLWHGFQSAFQTMGWSHPQYNPIIKGVGKAFAVIVPLLFALIPIVIYLR
ncbi:MAG: succinate dehydrogenase cytochrome b subunit [Flavobacteriia bacterium]|nr:succinate dehydrogenase cytochrome b subunit [Flavobacteriia bacterium]